MKRTKLDPNHIAQSVFDEESQANRVQVVNTEIAIELRAEDGDSVLTQSQMQVIQCKAGDVVDTSKATKICVTAQTHLSLVVLGNDIPLGQPPIGAVLMICSPAVKVSNDCIVILQS